MNEMRRVFFSILIILTLCAPAHGQHAKQAWVDSVFQTLSENQKIGQLIFTRLSSHLPEEVIKDVAKKTEAGMLGGLIFTSGSVRRQVKVTNYLQRSAQLPLLVAQDGSSGLGYLLDSTLTFPTPLAQAAFFDDSTIYHLAFDIGKQLRLLGVHMSLSPNAGLITADTDASILYGADTASVSKKSLLHMNGLRAAGILSCARHFPLRTFELFDEKNRGALTLEPDSIASLPFRHLMDNGLDAIIPDAVDLQVFYQEKKADLRKKLTEATFEKFKAGDLLQATLEYDGAIVLDIRTIEHSSDKFEPGDAGLLAFHAGADILITDVEPDAIFRKIKKALQAGKGLSSRLEKSVKKILALKYDAGLWQKRDVDVNSVYAGLNSAERKVFQRQLYGETVTVVRNENNIAPLSVLENKDFAAVITGDSTQRADIFHRVVRKYVPATRHIVGDRMPAPDLSHHDVILVAVFPETSKKALQNLMGALQELRDDQHVIVADFGCKIFEAYATRFPVVMTTYSDEYDVIGIVPQVIFGGHSARGILPVAYGDVPAGTGLALQDLDRLAYSFPEDAGIDGETLDKIAQIANEAINSGSTPGCYVLVAKGGKVVYDHAFGHLTYDQKIPVTDETIYDLASLTKVAATLQAIMFMEERGLIDIYKKLSVYLPELRGTNKKDITIIDALTHQSGLPPFVPLWPLTLEGPALKPLYYSSQQNLSYPLQIGPTLFGSPILRDSVWSWITYSPMSEKPVRAPYPYRYSDLGFMMFKQLAERGLNQPLEDFLQQNFYEPLGAYSLGYTPLSRFASDLIAPTELDTLFRGGLLIGTVHDERAAMLGGVSGHAGLFGTANDLSKLGQMLLQEGTYGGLRYYKPETVRRFTARQFASSRRGLGWDKPVHGEWNSPTSRYASPKTFGHTGFTGTCLWVDPEFDLVYVFLSNRVFPDRSDKLIQTNIRSRIQDVIYEAIFNFCKTNGSGF